MATVFIDGNQGTTGLRIAHRLKARDGLSLLCLPERERKSLPARAELARVADITFLCLPDDASRELVESLGEGEARLIDASTAHRTDPRFVYGFPELSPERPRAIAASRRVAVPGCHASGCVALLKPLLASGALAPDTAVSLTSLTGYSGGGKKMIAEYEAEGRPASLHAPRPYAVSQEHKHLPEIVRECGLAAPPVFQPIVMDAYSGMLVSLPIRRDMLRRGLSLTQAGEIYRAFYQGQPLVRVLQENPEAHIDSASLSGTDKMEIFVTGNDERMIAYARLDNLGKGASGAAIQCMNLMLGLDMTEGLVF